MLTWVNLYHQAVKMELIMSVSCLLSKQNATQTLSSSAPTAAASPTAGGAMPTTTAAMCPMRPTVVSKTWLKQLAVHDETTRKKLWVHYKRTWSLNPPTYLNFPRVYIYKYHRLQNSATLSLLSCCTIISLPSSSRIFPPGWTFYVALLPVKMS